MLKHFFSYYRPYKRLFLIDFICAIISAILELIFPLAVNRVIDEVLPEGNLKMILMFSVLLFTMYLFNTWMNYIVVAVGHEFGINVETDMRRDLFGHFQKQSYRYFDHAKTGENLSRLTTDLLEISEVAHHGPEDVFITLMTLLGAFLLMFNAHAPLAIITVILLPLMAFGLGFFNKRMTQVNTHIFENIASFTAGIANTLSGIRVVKAFANEAYERDVFESYNQGFRTNKLAFYRTMALSSSFNYLLVRLINLFAFLAGSYFTVIGELSLGELVGFILLANVFVRPLERINAMIELYPKGYAGFKRFREEMSRQPEIVDAKDAYPAPAFKGNIRYEGVNFSYEDGREILSDINLSITPGETVAFVGPSGAGKTTLVNLLPRFYEIDSGSITIDGHAIQAVTMESLRKQIGIVQQDVFLFTGTIRENVLYGRLDASPEEVDAAIDAAQLREVIADLPRGLDTEIGERGARLSGGQKQRLSIARIFLKNPAILILDEATSALDTQTEQFIQASLDSLAQGRTTLIIAHRLATVRHANRIVVVTPAGIVEDGSHEKLLALGGHYANLYNAQFAGGESL